jgi:hypothetical protein
MDKKILFLIHLKKLLGFKHDNVILQSGQNISVEIAAGYCCIDAVSSFYPSLSQITP